MTVAAHRGASTAYLLPSADLVDEETLTPRCPFLGLASFTEDDAKFFHGRESDTARVHKAVRQRPVTLVAGPSGCGKSSLIRAGVLPQLRAEGLSVTEFRPLPGAQPATVLARALMRVLEPGLGEVERLAQARELAGLLESGDDVPAELRGRVLAGGTKAGHVLARRLFVQLARPGDGETFSRRPMRTTDLAAELLDVAEELARSKLVVLSPAPGGAEGEEIVDLAHEALTKHWPRLNEWLVDSRDFRLWQEQLRADRLQAHTPELPEHPDYPRILAVFNHTTGPLRAKDVCEALGHELLPKNIEGTRAKLKRLVKLGILTEADTGNFARKQ